MQKSCTSYNTINAHAYESKIINERMDLSWCTYSE